MNEKEKSFLNFVKKECKKYGVTFRLEKKPYLVLHGDSNMEFCGGYFDGEEKVLACAAKRPDYISLLAHEYCHLTQWVENCDAWKKADDNESLNALAAWLNGENVKNIKYHLGVCRDLELDNEKRTVAIIKKFNLDIDIDLYIRRANSYVLFYNHMYYTRKWCTPSNSPYKVEAIYSNMSSKFNMKYKSMSNKVKRIFDKVYL
jgi:hypothetical protein